MTLTDMSALFRFSVRQRMQPLVDTVQPGDTIYIEIVFFEEAMRMEEWFALGVFVSNIFV